MSQITNVRKGTILTAEVLYPILKVVIIALIILIIFVTYMVYVSGGQNQITEMINKVFSWP